MVACIGINPSTARPDKLDNTLQSVKRIANFNGHDGWLMINVYPLRATDPTDLPYDTDQEICLENSLTIRASIIDLGIKTIWVAYGDLIESRDYLNSCMAEIYANLKDLDLQWKIVKNPTKKGHPRHPLYKATKSKLLDFDFDAYAEEYLSDA